MKNLLCLALSACAAHAPVAAPAAPTNYAYAAARVNFPTGDSIAVGEHTAIVRDALVLAMCIETDAAHHTKCVALADYTPKQEAPKSEAKPPEPAPVVTPPAKAEAPKKK